MADETTLDTLEFGLGTAVALVDTAASGAGPTRVAGIDRHAGDTGIDALVRQEETQLSEGPGR